MNDGEMRRRPHHADGDEIGQRIIGQMSIKGLVDGLRAIGADEQCVSVGLSTARFRGSDIAAGAWLVLDHHGLPKHGFEVLSQEPRRQVRASSRRKWHQDGYCLAWPSTG